MTLGDVLNKLGAAQPRDDFEQGVANVGRAVSSVGGGVGAGKILEQGVNQTAQRIGQVLQKSPGTQTAAALTGGTAAEVAGQKGYGPVVQTAAGFAGGVAGGLGADAAVSATQAVGRGAKGLVQPFFKGGQESIAGGILANQADDPIAAASRLSQSQEIVPGSKPTSGQASLDRGLMAVEKAKADQNPSAFSARRSQQNTARQQALERVAGSEADIAAAEASRNATTGLQRDAALNNPAGGKYLGIKPQTDKVVQFIDDKLASPTGKRDVPRAALEWVKGKITPDDSPEELYAVRKDINDAIAGKLDKDKSTFRFAKKQLIEVRNVLDDAIEPSAPGFKAYLRRYADESKPIDNMKALQEIQMRSGMAAPDITSGFDVLSQAKFRQVVTRLENAGDLKSLTVSQRETINAVGADLDVGAGMAQALRTSGSDTFQNASVANLISAARGKAVDLPPLVQNILGPLKWVYSLSDSQIDALLTDAMLDPKLAGTLLQKANAKSVSSVSVSLRQKAVAATIGAALGSTQEKRQGTADNQPLSQ